MSTKNLFAKQSWKKRASLINIFGKNAKSIPQIMRYAFCFYFN
jgi:hypothetical protein